MAPGTLLEHRVRHTALLAETIESFDLQDYVARLAAVLGHKPSLISTRLAAASIGAVSIISPGSRTAAIAAQAALQAMSPALLSSLLAVAILSHEAVITTSIAYAPQWVPVTPPLAPSLPLLGSEETVSALRAAASLEDDFCKLAWFAPGSCPFEVFAFWIAPPLTAAVAMGTVLALRGEPHFSGFADSLAAMPLALLVCTCGVTRRKMQRRAAIAIKTALVALLEGAHYWHTVRPPVGPAVTTPHTLQRPIACTCIHARPSSPYRCSL